MREMDQSLEASRARARVVLEMMASPEGDPLVKRQLIRKLSAADPKVRTMARALQTIYFPKEERLEL